jgi:hypothetical protein
MIEFILLQISGRIEFLFMAKGHKENGKGLITLMRSKDSITTFLWQQI